MAPARADTTLRLTPAGRMLLPFALAGAVLSWAAGGAVGLLAAGAPGLFGAAALLAWLQVRALEPRSPRARRAFAGAPTVVTIELANRSRLVPAVDVVLARGAKPGARPAGLVATLAPRATAAVPLGVRFARRGRRRRLVVALSTSFPFGLVACRRVHAVPCDLLVLPMPGEVDAAPPAAGTAAAAPTPRRAPEAGDEELWGLREWREGEGLRRVHWPLSARRGRRVVRDLRRRTEPPVHVVLLARPTGTPPSAGSAREPPRAELAAGEAHHPEPAGAGFRGSEIAVVQHPSARSARAEFSRAESSRAESSGAESSGAESSRAEFAGAEFASAEVAAARPRGPGRSWVATKGERSLRAGRRARRREGAVESSGRARDRRFERVVRVAAAVLERALEGDGVAWLSIAGPEGATRAVGPLRGRRGLLGALEILAEVAPVAERPAAVSGAGVSGAGVARATAGGCAAGVEAALAAAWGTGPRGARRVLVGAGSRRRPLRRLAVPAGTLVLDVEAQSGAPCWSWWAGDAELEVTA